MKQPGRCSDTHDLSSPFTSSAAVPAAYRSVCTFELILLALRRSKRDWEIAVSLRIPTIYQCS